MLRTFALIWSLMALLIAAPAQADAALDRLARDIDRTESVRAVKALQNHYAQYAQAGLWEDVGRLFAADGQFIFDGQIMPARTARGPAAIAAFLRNRYGGGREGAWADGLSATMIDNPVLNLTPDGDRATVRWAAMIFHGRGTEARIEGGVFVNDYVRDGGTWKIARAHYYPQFDGPYEQGWTNWGGGDLPIPPYHFTVDQAGIPIPPSAEAAPRAAAPLDTLHRRAALLNEEDRIRNLQAIYGYYQDRKMWDDVVDLFAADGIVEVGGQGVWHGPAGVRRWLESMGPAGLQHGQLNDRVQFNVTVTIAPGGNEAWARGMELGMLGEADQEKGWWEVATFRNRFVREDGVWKIRELRRFPQMKTDIFQGWGRNRIVEPAPSGSSAPDAGIPEPDRAASGLAVPAFLGPHPVTGQPITAAGDGTLVAAAALTGPIRAREAPAPDLAEARRLLARAAAYDGAANVASAYGFYLDDSKPSGFNGLIAEQGFKMSPFTGFYITRARNLEARAVAQEPETRPGISYHWLMQPVMLVSDDGRSVSSHVRLFQPRTGKTAGEAGDFFAASFWGGMYYNQYVLEDGVWRLWNLTLDEPLIVPVSWKDGLWAKAKDPPPGSARTFSSGNFPPDITKKEIGRRFEHTWGGSGETWQWPTILPMWFEFRNPVSGREPEFFQQDCAPCTIRPHLRLDRSGYQQTPDAPEANRSR
jgi:predicted transcriptional regulator